MIYCAHQDQEALPDLAMSGKWCCKHIHHFLQTCQKQTLVSHTKVKDRKVITYHKQVLNLKPFHQVDIKFRKYNHIKKLHIKPEITSVAAKFSFNSRKKCSYINSMEGEGISKSYLKCKRLKRKKKVA